MLHLALIIASTNSESWALSHLLLLRPIYSHATTRTSSLVREARVRAFYSLKFAWLAISTIIRILSNKLLLLRVLLGRVRAISLINDVCVIDTIKLRLAYCTLICATTIILTCLIATVGAFLRACSILLFYAIDTCLGILQGVN